MSGKKPNNKTKNTPAKISSAKKEKTPTAIEDLRNSGTRIPIQLLVDYKANGHYLFDFCRDLGTGGVFIETNAPLPQGSKLDLTFTIPDSKETLDATGTVIWAQYPIEGKTDLTAGMGVQFDQFNHEQRLILEKFVTRYHGSDFGQRETA